MKFRTRGSSKATSSETFLFVMCKIPGRGSSKAPLIRRVRNLCINKTILVVWSCCKFSSERNFPCFLVIFADLSSLWYLIFSLNFPCLFFFFLVPYMQTRVLVSGPYKRIVVGVDFVSNNWQLPRPQIMWISDHAFSGPFLFFFFLASGINISTF